MSRGNRGVWRVVRVAPLVLSAAAAALFPAIYIANAWLAQPSVLRSLCAPLPGGGQIEYREEPFPRIRLMFGPGDIRERLLWTPPRGRRRAHDISILGGGLEIRERDRCGLPSPAHYDPTRDLSS